MEDESDRLKGKYIKTVLLFLAYMTKGLCLEIVGPTMIDMKLLYSTNYESVARALAGRGAGGFLGAVIGGILADKFEKWLDLLQVVAVATTASAAAIIFVPCVPNINYVWLLYFSLGNSNGIVNIAGTRMILKLHKDRTTSAIQMLHMGYGVGALLAPVIALPFLMDNGPTTAGDTVVKESRIHMAYLAVGFITLSVAVPFYYFVLKEFRNGYQLKQKEIKSTKDGKTLLEMINPATYADGNFTFGLYMFFLLLVYFFNLVGGEKTFAIFIRSFSVDVFNFQKDESSYLNMIFWISLTVGRLTGIVIAHFLPIKTLFLGQVTAHLATVLLLNVYAVSSANMLWLLTMLEGFIVGPLYGYGVSYGSTQINVTGICLMVIVFAGSFGDLTYLWIAGRMYDTYGPTAILYETLVASILLFITVVFFLMSRRKISDRSLHKTSSVHNDLSIAKRQT